jgi:RNA recognition motif-containing protein
MNLFVAKLHAQTTNEDLRELFSQFGEVTKASVILDKETGESRGFGFVDMPDADAARLAIQRLDGSNVKGRFIVVKEADDRRNAAPGAGNREGGFRPPAREGFRDERRPDGFRPGPDRRSGERPGYERPERPGYERPERPGYERPERSDRSAPDRYDNRDNRDNRPAERGPARQGFGPPPPFTEESGEDFRKPARFSGKGKEPERKKGDKEKRSAPRKSSLAPPPKKLPKKGRSFEDFEDDY